MADMRPELSYKNKYWISKHRYYELVHFCRQYEDWKGSYRRISDKIMDLTAPYDSIHTTPREVNSHTEWLAERLYEYDHKIRMIDRLCKEADPFLGDYIKKAVTEGKSYTQLSTQYDLPCAKQTFFDRYHRFFWLLSKERD